MVYQIIQDSPWHYIFGFGGLLLIAAIIVLASSRSMSISATVWLGGLGIALAFACIVGAFVVDHQRDAQNDANFNKQLMDEYGVTSSRNLYAIHLDFSRFDEARTVFTKDGKETPVYIKLVHSDDNHYEMAFTVIDQASLFPKLNK